MSDSIHDQLGEASSSHHLIRYEYPQKRLFTGAGAAGFNFYHVHPIQTKDQSFYGFYPASVPGRGPAKVQGSGFGLGANGVGITFPPPKPGSIIFAAEPNRGQVIRLGEMPVHGVGGETGLDRIDQNGVQVRSQSYLPIQSTYAANGFSIVTSVPRPDLTATPSGTPLFSELPGNVHFTSFTNATTYEVNVNATHRMYRSEPTIALGFLGNNTAALQSLANQHKAVSQYEAFLSGEQGVYFIDPTQKIPTLYETSFSPGRSITQAGRAAQSQTQAQRLSAAESFATLPQQQDEFRQATYIALQKAAETCRSQNRLQSNILGMTPRQLDYFIQQMNAYLPAALGILDLIRGDRPKLETSLYILDPYRLTLEPNLKLILSVLNRYLPLDLHLKYAAETKTLTYLAYSFQAGQSFSFTAAQIAGLTRLNGYLPDALKITLYRYRGEVTAVKFAPGIYLYPELGLLLPDLIDLPAYVLSKLRCGLPPQVFERLNPIYSPSPSGGRIKTNLDSPSFGDQFLQELLALINQSDSFEELGINTFNRLTEFLPAELRNVFYFDRNQRLQISTENLMQGGATLLNQSLPDWMQIGLQFDQSRVSQFSVGPLSLSIKNGLTLGVDFQKLGLLKGGFDLLDIVNVLPDSFRGGAAVQKVIYPYDKLSSKKVQVSSFGLSFVLKGPPAIDSLTSSKAAGNYAGDLINNYLKQGFGDEETTINTGGNLPSNSRLGIDKEPNGSPYPLLKFAASLLSNLRSRSIGGKGYFPGYSPIAVAPLTGKRYLTLVPEVCYTEQSLISSEVLVNPKSDIPLTLEQYISDPLDRQIITVLTEYGIGPEGVRVLEDLSRFITPSSTRPEYQNQSRITDLLSLIGTASPPIQIPFYAAAVTLGVDPETRIDSLREIQSIQNPSCADITLVELGFTLLDGSQTQLDLYTSEYGFPPLPLDQVLDQPFALVEWIDQNEPEFSPAVQYLLLGDVYRFLVEWVYYRTRIDLYRYPERLLMLHHLLMTKFRLAVPGFDLIEEITERS